MRAGHYNTGRRPIGGRCLSGYCPRTDFHFFHRRGGKILGGVQVICNMPFLMLREGHEMANQSAPGGWSKILEGVKHFLKRVKKDLGGVNPPSPPSENPPMILSPEPPREFAGSGAKLYLGQNYIWGLMTSLFSNNKTKNRRTVHQSDENTLRPLMPYTRPILMGPCSILVQYPL